MLSSDQFTSIYRETLRDSIACYHQRQADINDYDSTDDDDDDGEGDEDGEDDNDSLERKNDNNDLKEVKCKDDLKAENVVEIPTSTSDVSASISISVPAAAAASVTIPISSFCLASADIQAALLIPKPLWYLFGHFSTFTFGSMTNLLL
jgi:hypothetical protein